jgi:Tol biopolymer transport system component
LQEAQDLSLSKDNARLLYTRVQSYSNLWLVKNEAKGVAGTIETKQLTSGTSSISWPSISPDGKRIAFRRGSPTPGNICVMPTTGGQIEQLTFFNSNNDCPVWSPDSREIAFGSNQDGAPRVWKVNSDGGTPRPFDKSELSANALLLAWSPGSNILYLRPGHRNHQFLNPNTEEEWPFVKNDSVGWMFYPKYSPDGKRVAVSWRRATSRESGIWIVSLKDSSQSLAYRRYLMPIQWSADGKWIYAWDHKARSPEILMVNASNGKAKEFLTLPLKDIRSISMCPDGKKIIVTVSETQSDAWLVENFDTGVK